MEQLSHDEMSGGLERQRTSFTTIAAERVAALKEHIGKSTPRALALVAALWSAAEKIFDASLYTSPEE